MINTKALCALALVTFGSLFFAGCGGGGGSSNNSTTTTAIQGTPVAGYGITVGSASGTVGNVTSVPVTLAAGSTTRAVSFTIGFDPKYLAPGENTTANSISNPAIGPVIGSDIVCRHKWGSNSVTLWFAAGNAANAFSNSYTIVNLPFSNLNAGSTSLTVSNITAYDDNLQPITVTKGAGGK